MLRARAADINTVLDIDIDREERPFVFDLTPDEVASLTDREIGSDRSSLPGRLRTRIATEDLP
jgi:hypothetical protein